MYIMESYTEISPIYISGIGTVGAFGRGLESLENALFQGDVSPVFVDVHGINIQVPVYSVAKEDLKEKALSRKMRRADKFSKMAAVAAFDAFNDSGFSIDSADNSMGIILSTAFGPHATTFDFLDGYIDFGENAVSPTTFSHSVHNAAASYISSILGIRGSTQTVTNFNLPFQNALLLAQTWLKQGRCKNILLGCVDELGPQMEYVFSQKYNYADDGEIHPFTFSATPEVVPGEGCTFFMLTTDPNSKEYCKISDVNFNCNLGTDADVKLLDGDGMSGSETRYKDIASSLNNKTLLAAYTPAFGSMKINTAFHCAIGALMLKKQCVYPCLELGNPSVVNICTKHEQRNINTVSCLKLEKNNSLSELILVS